jgi:hypothetical protein
MCQYETPMSLYRNNLNNKVMEILNVDNVSRTNKLKIKSTDVKSEVLMAVTMLPSSEI